MAPKKSRKQPKNAFYYFVLDFEKNMGQAVANLDTDEFGERASREWHRLPGEERKRYQEMANYEREKGGKYTSLGVLVSVQDRLEKERRDLVHRIELDIEELINTLGMDPLNALVEHPFYFLHCNCFVRTEKGYVVPAEIAISEFTIRNGIQRLFSKFLNIRDIPQGYSCTAKEIAAKTHKIPPPPGVPPPSTNDAVEVLEKLTRFIHGLHLDDEQSDLGDRNDPQPMFTSCREIEIVRECIGAIVAETHTKEPVVLKVYPLESLFHNLLKLCHRVQGQQAPMSTLTMAESELEKDRYSYAPNIACAFHEEADERPHCSRAKVHRWGYVISDFVCAALEVEMIDNRHCPPNAKRSHAQSVRHKFPAMTGGARLQFPPKKNALPQLKQRELHVAPGGRGLTRVESSVCPGEPAKPSAGNGRFHMIRQQIKQYEDEDLGAAALPLQRDQKPELVRVKGEEWKALKIQPVRSQPWEKSEEPISSFRSSRLSANFAPRPVVSLPHNIHGSNLVDEEQQRMFRTPGHLAQQDLHRKTAGTCELVPPEKSEFLDPRVPLGQQMGLAAERYSPLQQPYSAEQKPIRRQSVSTIFSDDSDEEEEVVKNRAPRTKSLAMQAFIHSGAGRGMAPMMSRSVAPSPAPGSRPCTPADMFRGPSRGRGWMSIHNAAAADQRPPGGLTDETTRGTAHTETFTPFSCPLKLNFNRDIQTKRDDVSGEGGFDSKPEIVSDQVLPLQKETLEITRDTSEGVDKPEIKWELEKNCDDQSHNEMRSDSDEYYHRSSNKKSRRYSDSDSSEERERKHKKRSNRDRSRERYRERRKYDRNGDGQYSDNEVGYKERDKHERKRDRSWERDEKESRRRKQRDRSWEREEKESRRRKELKRSWEKEREKSWERGKKGTSDERKSRRNDPLEKSELTPSATVIKTEPIEVVEYFPYKVVKMEPI